MEKIGKIQLGKNGVTGNFIQCLESTFKNHRIVKLHVLKSATRDRKQLKEQVEEIVKRLGGNYSARIIGFTVVMRKSRKSKV